MIPDVLIANYKFLNGLSDSERKVFEKAAQISTDTELAEWDKDVKAACEKTNNVDAAAQVGTAIAKKALEKGITTVVFDRGGFIYSGKVKALADAAREAGLEF